MPTAGGAGPDATLAQTSPTVAALMTGAGASYIQATVMRNGNLYLESPKGAVLVDNEGYSFCSGPTSSAFAVDLPFSDDGFQWGFRAPTVTQPKAGVFPVTIRRTTTDGRLRFVQTWAVPDTAEKDITVTMTVTNVGNTTVSALELTRMTQTMDEFHHPFFLAGTTTDSAFQWWHEVDPATPTHGVVATAASFGKPHDAGLATDTDLGDACGDYDDARHRATLTKMDLSFGYVVAVDDIEHVWTSQLATL
jgi:hypothetical protein